MEYLVLKWIHILGATVLFGTGIGTAFVLFIANRNGNLEGIRFATRYVVLADWRSNDRPDAKLSKTSKQCCSGGTGPFSGANS